MAHRYYRLFILEVTYDRALTDCDIAKKDSYVSDVNRRAFYVRRDGPVLDVDISAKFHRLYARGRIRKSLGVNHDGAGATVDGTTNICQCNLAKCMFTQ